MDVQAGLCLSVHKQQCPVVLWLFVRWLACGCCLLEFIHECVIPEIFADLGGEIT